MIDLLFELEDDFLLLLFQLANEFIEAFVDVVQLLFKEPGKLFLDLLDHLCIVLNEALGVVDHLAQINHVLLHRVRYDYRKSGLKRLQCKGLCNSVIKYYCCTYPFLRPA